MGGKRFYHKLAWKDWVTALTKPGVSGLGPWEFEILVKMPVRRDEESYAGNGRETENIAARYLARAVVLRQGAHVTTTITVGPARSSLQGRAGLWIHSIPADQFIYFILSYPSLTMANVTFSVVLVHSECSQHRRYPTSSPLPIQQRYAQFLNMFKTRSDRPFTARSYFFTITLHNGGVYLWATPLIAVLFRIFCTKKNMSSCPKNCTPQPTRWPCRRAGHISSYI